MEDHRDSIVADDMRFDVDVPRCGESNLVFTEGASGGGNVGGPVKEGSDPGLASLVFEFDGEGGVDHAIGVDESGAQFFSEGIGALDADGFGHRAEGQEGDEDDG